MGWFIFDDGDFMKINELVMWELLFVYWIIIRLLSYIFFFE